MILLLDILEQDSVVYIVIMYVNQTPTFYVALSIVFTSVRFCLSVKLENYCKPTKSTNEMSNTEGHLISSIIGQMQLNLDGALSCTTVIADPLDESIAKGWILTECVLYVKRN